MVEDNKSSEAEAPSRPNYPEYFGNVRIAGDLLSSESGRGWMKSLPNPVPKHRYVVWLGCQVLRTVHLVESSK